MGEAWHQRPTERFVPIEPRPSCAAHPQLVENFAPWLRLQRAETLALLLHAFARELDNRGVNDAAQLIVIGDQLVHGALVPRR